MSVFHFFLWPINILCCGCNTFICSSVDGLGYFHFWAIMNNTSVNIGVQFFKKILLVYLFIYLFIFGVGGRGKRGSETSMCGCSHTPHWGPGPQPRQLNQSPLVLRLALNPLSHTSQGWCTGFCGRMFSFSWVYT